MDTEQKAVGNQKVFVTLKNVLALQDCLRGKEKELEQYARELYTMTGPNAREATLVRESIIQIEALNGMIELLGLPIQTESGHRTLNRVRASLPQKAA